MNKSKIRVQKLNERNKLTLDQLEVWSSQILQLFKKTVSLENVKYLHTYISKGNEVDTRKLIGYLQQKYPGIVVCVPKMGETGIRNLELNDLNECEKNRFGVLEPKIENEIDISKIDLVIVPCAAFDIKQNRIGYGYGYYDKFLAQLRPGCLKVGLAFEMQRTKELIDNEKYDVKLDRVITEESIQL